MYKKIVENSTPLTFKSGVQKKKDPYREARRLMVCRMARESKRGVAPKRIS